MPLAARHWHSDAAAAALAVPAIASALSADSLTWEAIGTGGPCEAWSADTFDGKAQFWICCPDNTLGKADDGWLVGLQPRDEWNDHWQTSAPTMVEALALVHAAHAARAFALGFQPAPAPVPQWQREFPDFPAADMPAIPAGWTDQSWHNDACPSFLASPSLAVFVDFADPNKREHTEGVRFVVVTMENGDHPLAGSDVAFSGDDWQAVLDFVAAYVPPAPATPQTGEAAPVIVPQEGNLDALTDELNAYAAEHGLEPMSADEMAMERREVARRAEQEGDDAAARMAYLHAEWLDDFCERWSAEEERLTQPDQTGEAAPEFVGIPYSGENVEKLATAFFVQCEAQFDADELALIRAQNRRYADEGKVGVCATHDYADANMIMLDAFEDAFGRKPACLIEGAPEAADETEQRLWNDAWSFAVARDLMGAPVTSTALRRAAVAARDMLESHMSETFGPDKAAWSETVFWQAYCQLVDALK